MTIQLHNNGNNTPITDATRAQIRTDLGIVTDPFVTLAAIEVQLREQAKGWYDIAGQYRMANLTASDIGGVKSSLTQIADLSNAGTPANKQNNVVAPVVSSNLQAGKRYLEFVGKTQNRRMLSNINLNVQNCELTAVLQLDPTAPARIHYGGKLYGVFGHDDRGWDRFLWIREDGQMGGGGASSGRWNTDNIKMPVSRWTVVTVGFYTGSPCEAWLDGAKVYSFTGKNYSTRQGSNQTVFGDLDPSGAFPFSGYIAEFICFTEKTSDVFKQNLHSALRAKWGVG